MFKHRVSHFWMGKWCGGWATFARPDSSLGIGATIGETKAGRLGGMGIGMFAWTHATFIACIMDSARSKDKSDHVVEAWL